MMAKTKSALEVKIVPLDSDDPEAATQFSIAINGTARGTLEMVGDGYRLACGTPETCYLFPDQETAVKLIRANAAGIKSGRVLDELAHLIPVEPDADTATADTKEEAVTATDTVTAAEAMAAHADGAILTADDLAPAGAPALAWRDPSELPPVLYDDTYTGPRYTYGLRYRPVTGDGAPRGYILHSDRPHADYQHGTVDYPAALTDEQVAGYELAVLHTCDTCGAASPDGAIDCPACDPDRQTESAPVDEDPATDPAPAGEPSAPDAAPDAAPHKPTGAEAKAAREAKKAADREAKKAAAKEAAAAKAAQSQKTTAAARAEAKAEAKAAKAAEQAAQNPARPAAGEWPVEIGSPCTVWRTGKYWGQAGVVTGEPLASCQRRSVKLGMGDLVLVTNAQIVTTGPAVPIERKPRAQRAAGEPRAPRAARALTLADVIAFLKASGRETLEAVQLETGSALAVMAAGEVIAAAQSAGAAATDAAQEPAGAAA